MITRSSPRSAIRSPVGFGPAGLRIRDAGPDDLDRLARAFATCPKPRSLFVDYLSESGDGAIDLLVAERDDALAGYTPVRWTSTYPPFASEGIPEICDLTVLAGHRRHGVGNALMDEAERRIARRSERAGIGVGLSTGYGSAQRMYVRRGYLPDGAGVVVDDVPVAPGTMITIDDGPELKSIKRLV